MYAPPCSWRTGTNSTVDPARDSLRSSVSSPGMPNTYLTPSASRHSTNTSDALRLLTPAPYLTGPLAVPGPRPARACRRARLRAACLVTVLAVALSAVGAAGARAATVLYIRGGGTGHGIGMSQYGAYGYALHGLAYRAILAHYYTGTALGQVDPARIVRVLLATGTASFTGATRARPARRRERAARPRCARRAPIPWSLPPGVCCRSSAPAGPRSALRSRPR